VNTTTQNKPWHGVVAGLAGGAAWLVGHTVIFGPLAQFVLFNEAFQSETFLTVWTQEPLPLQNQMPVAYVLCLLLISMIWGQVYRFVAQGWVGPWWQRGLQFGVVAWALVVPWFEFFVPWNLLQEPFWLVLVEVAAWLPVWLLVGLAIARTAAALAPRVVL